MMVEDMCSSPFLSRRQFIGSSALCLFAGSIADAQPRLPQFAVADISDDINVNLVEIDRRLSILKGIGFDMIRTEIGWSDFEIVEGQWKINDARLRYLDAVKRSGLKIKVVISTYSNAPMWFFERHENAKLFNSYGKSPSSLISPWYPGVSKIVEDVQTRIFTDLASYGIFDFTNSIIADLGPAAEAIYPASWETIDKRPSSFWFYGDLARKSFMDYALRHYGSLDILNSHWNVNLGSPALGVLSNGGGRRR